MKLPLQPIYRYRLEAGIQGAIQWVWQELVKAINFNDTGYIEAEFVLSNDQIINLPTSPIDLLPEPGPGKVYRFINATLIANFVDLYTGIADGDYFGLNISSYVFDLAAEGVDDLTSLFVTGNYTVVFLEPYVPGVINTDSWGPRPYGFNDSNFNIYVALNAAGGNLAGGNPLNTLKIKLRYEIVEL